MGSDSSVSIAEIVMQFIEVKINSFIGADKIPLLRSYVDNVCIFCFGWVSLTSD